MFVIGAMRLSGRSPLGKGSCAGGENNLAFSETSNESETTITLILYAQPYDISAEGFYFRNLEEFEQRSAATKNSAGDRIEEFELQFVDGLLIDAELAKAWGLNQATIGYFLDAVEGWDEEDKIRFILAVGEGGYSFDPEMVAPPDFDVDIYRLDCMRDLAIQFVGEGLFGEIPEHLQSYIDYDAIARDLAMDYSEAVIVSERFIYRCG